MIFLIHPNAQIYYLHQILLNNTKNFQVETIGDAYMVVSGAPSKEMDHADRVCDMALDMVEAITDLKDRSTGNISNNNYKH